ncbi:MAG: ABC transporter ATP-binding protein, partial [Myxococcales bacterium]
MNEQGSNVPKLQLERVGKIFQAKTGEVEALRNVSLTLQAGEFVSLVGPSGCGKTTTLNIIAGLEEADEGKVLVDGRAVRGPGPDRTVMFQESALFPWMTVRKNVEFGLMLKGVGRAARRAKAEEFLRLVHLQQFADS